MKTNLFLTLRTVVVGRQMKAAWATWLATRTFWAWRTFTLISEKAKAHDQQKPHLLR